MPVWPRIPTLYGGRPMDLVTAVDASPKGAFLVDADGMLRHANAAGQRALNREDFLRLRAGRLRPASPDQERKFSRLLGTVTAGNGQWTRCGTIRLLGVRGASAVLFVHSVGNLPSFQLGGFRAALLLSVRARDPEIDSIRLRITFGFTSAEDRLARDLIRGGSLKETGEKYHLGRETLKSQLGSMFRKTGTHRQGELVAFLLSSLSDPSA